MNITPITQRLLSLADEHEKHQQDIYAADLLREAAAIISKADDMLQRLEWCNETPGNGERDTVTTCPVCGEGSIVGLDAKHAADCELSALLKSISKA